MKIVNLTDIPTAKLEQHKLVAQCFEVDGKLVAPGTSVEVRGSIADHPRLRHLLQVGAAATDDAIPKEYLKAKAIAVAQPAPPITQSSEDAPAPVPMSRRSKGG